MQTLRHAESVAALRGVWKLGRLMWMACLIAGSLMLTGCHGSNHYYATNSAFGQRMPDSLRLAKRSNPQTVDLSKLASGTGGSETIGAGDVLEVPACEALVLEVDKLVKDHGLRASLSKRAMQLIPAHQTSLPQILMQTDRCHA